MTTNRTNAKITYRFDPNATYECELTTASFKGSGPLMAINFSVLFKIKNGRRTRPEGRIAKVFWHTDEHGVPSKSRWRKMLSPVCCPCGHPQKWNWQRVSGRSFLIRFQQAQCSDTQDPIAEIRLLEKPKNQLTETSLDIEPNLASDTIVAFGECQYTVGNERPYLVSRSEDIVLQGFLAKATMGGAVLAKVHDQAPRILRRLRTKYQGIFANAIHLPGKKGHGGYHVAIRAATPRVAITPK